MRIFTLLTILSVSGLLPLQSQSIQREKSWIYFSSKTSSEPFALSARSLERRRNQGIIPDQMDRPVSSSYLSQLTAMGVEIAHTSRWLNAVSVYGTPENLTAVKSLPFVKEVKKVIAFHSKQEIKGLSLAPANKTGYDPGYSKDQLSMVGLDVLHSNGFNGAGVLISVMDNGFNNANKNPGLSHLFKSGRVLATWDFQDKETDVWTDGDHGAQVLSILAGYIEGQFVGSAPGASYILARTEVNGFERHIEEDNWVAAAEWADSIGADIFSTSLGYSDFEIGEQDYTPADMDGNTTVITRAADMAASRGILVINSAGNEGRGSWRIIIAPADGDSVLAVGSVDKERVLSDFSSVGPSADGRIKPDLCAMGGSTYFIHTDEKISYGSGTSFSCPIMSGLAACLWQSKPILTNMQLFDQLKRSADNYTSPDFQYGYGIPNGILAFKNINGFHPSDSPKNLSLNENGIGMYPNPTANELNIVFNNTAAMKKIEIEGTDLNGKRMFFVTPNLNPFYNVLKYSKDDLLMGLETGIYIITIRDQLDGNKLFSGKLFLNQ